MSPRLAAAAAVAALTLSACASLPTAPPPLPDTFVADVALPTPAPAIPVGDDGFTSVERVALRVSVMTCDEYGNGSAWVLDENTAVTNRHVVEGALEIGLTSYDGRHYTGTSSVLSESTDLALVHIDGTFPETATIAARGPERRDVLHVVGYPEGGRLTSTAGEFTNTTPETIETGQDDVYELYAHIEPGNSGSPVVDEVGEVVGVAYAAGAAGWSYAVTLDSLTQFLATESAQVPNTAECER
ncbi:S1 family peptidase [Demequina aestuarii]|uniref:S1 family peptidase n=1 Tax=Demequina aestuarii TaxID=327095 RepID=UPI00078457E9|nr:serine protease [Demequina aestuarii]